MNKDISPSRIHGGHRGRMRSKLAAHGHEIFDSYELLEMLLYQVIPCIDTNPVAKRLLHKFGTLDALFAADAEEIATVRGVGKECAELIRAVGAAYDLLGIELGCPQNRMYKKYTLVGEYFTDYFSSIDGYGIAVILLDNSMRMLDSFTAFEGLDYGNSRMDVGVIVRRALDMNATAVITAHNHPNGPLFPTPDDRSANAAVTDALSSLGIIHLEHYIVCGRKYLGIMDHLKERFAAYSEIHQFLESKDAFIAEELRGNGAGGLK